VDDVRKELTQPVLPLSAASIAVSGGWVCPTAALGADIRSHVELNGGDTAVRIAPTHRVMRDKSALLVEKRVETTLRNTQQLSGYGFGTPVGVGALRVDVVAGVPPRSRPV
jgi:hypothetical protein